MRKFLRKRITNTHLTGILYIACYLRRRCSATFECLVTQQRHLSHSGKNSDPRHAITYKLYIKT